MERPERRSQPAPAAGTHRASCATASGGNGCCDVRPEPSPWRAWPFVPADCPAENLQMSAGIFDKGAAAFNPVSVVEVEDAADRRIAA